MSLASTFGFRVWPFAVVPDETRAAELWADRAEARAELEAMLEEWTISPASSLHLVWADLGAGKTHTLMHLRAIGVSTGEFCPIYALLPSQTTSFAALYSAIVGGIDWRMVRNGFQSDGSWVGDGVDVALSWLLSDIDAVRRTLAGRWLRTDRLTAKECERLGVASPIRTVDDAVAALTVVLGSLVMSGPRVVVMIDEYQRVAEGTRKQLQEVGHGVHTVFNACPRNVSWILSCAAGGGGDVEFVLTPELVSRMSMRRIDLPYLSSDDVVVYLRDLFEYYRANGEYPELFPLTLASSKVVAVYLVEDGRLDLTPRGVNKAFEYILSELARSSAIAPFEADFVAEWLAEHGAAMLARIHD